MAKFELKFIDIINENEHIKTNVSNGDVISISGVCNGKVFEIWLDKSTSIKFAKTLRTEINKIIE